MKVHPTPRGSLLIPAECDVWAVYALVPEHEGPRFDPRLIRTFAENFYREATNRGMKLSNPAEIVVLTTEKDLENKMKTAAQHSCKFCLIVTADSITSVHKQIKLWERELEMVTQDVKLSNALKVLTTEKDLENKMKTAAQHSCKFCLIVTADSITSVHKQIKLWERELEMVTQDVKLSNALKVVNERRVVTLENILLKSNLKMGGLNYELELPRDETAKNWVRPGRLFLGIGVSHPPPTTKFDPEKGTPSVVGYAANFKANYCDIVGDYLFQSSRREETISTMSEVVNNVIPKFAENHDGKFPRDLIIYRSGLSEGSFSTVLTHEIPLLRGALSTLGAKNVKITFIVAQKEHNVRLMLERIDRSLRPTGQNIPPGVVVDTQLTHPSFKEFYLNSHITLQVC
ncbi:piwi domain protein [Oesophagostomum dentatum]|uniref:Piwi domain protein n=1 Tax=Oesophagostomum dentatum TaxID=61180 RepID=A0A0B1SV15_OESDE|nr:piwi domain protein [Oesophagostomum dentatum]